MPFKSQAQRKWMFAAEARGQLPKGKAEQWAHETPNIKNLPERVHVGGTMRKMKAPEGSPKEEAMESPAKEAAEQRKGPMKNAAPLFTSKDGGNMALPIKSQHSTTKHAHHKGEPDGDGKIAALYGATKKHFKIG